MNPDQKAFRPTGSDSLTHSPQFTQAKITVAIAHSMSNCEEPELTNERLILPKTQILSIRLYLICGNSGGARQRFTLPPGGTERGELEEIGSRPQDRRGEARDPAGLGVAF